MEKAALRNTLKKLRRIPFDEANYANVMMAPQEMLDFLAMTAGLKPVCLVGRGFDDPSWINGVVELAQQMKLHVIQGWPWEAVGDESPDWFREVSQENPKPQGDIVYICRARGPAEAVAKCCAARPLLLRKRRDCWATLSAVFVTIIGETPCSTKHSLRW
jgi:hypothetical protein